VSQFELVAIRARRGHGDAHAARAAAGLGADFEELGPNCATGRAFEPGVREPDPAQCGLGRMLQAIERAFAHQRDAVGPTRLQPPQDWRQRRSVANLVVVGDVLVTQGAPEHTLA